MAELQKSPRFNINMSVPGRTDVLTLMSNDNEINQMKYKRNNVKTVENNKIKNKMVDKMVGLLY